MFNGIVSLYACVGNGQREECMNYWAIGLFASI